MVDNVQLSSLGAVIKDAYEAQPDTNAFTDSEKLKLDSLSPVAGLVSFKSVTTYAEMINDGNPTVATFYSVTNDENKNYTRSTYLWKSNGNREWIASTPDN